MYQVVVNGVAGGGDGGMWVGVWMVWYMCGDGGVSVTREQLRKRENRKGNEHEKGDNVPIAGFQPTTLYMPVK